MRAISTQQVRRFATWMLLLALAANFPSAFSQVLQTPDSEEQRRRAFAEEVERKRQAHAPNVALPTGAAAPEMEPGLPAEAPCFLLRHLTLTPAPQLSGRNKFTGDSAPLPESFHFAQQYLDRYSGSCVGKDGINMLVGRLTQLLLHNGFSTTRVGLPEQNLAAGNLTVTLVPGVIHAIRFADPILYGTWRNAFPSGAGALLNLRELEQGLEQMKRVSSQDVAMQIVPAETPGESDVVLTIARSKPWKISASLDNSGAKATGQYQAGANLSFDNLFGISDLFNIGINSDVNHDADARGTGGHNLYYAVPFGFWYYSLAASANDYHQQIAGASQSTVFSGTSKNLNFTFNHLFQRDQFQKNSWLLSLSKRWAHSFIDNTEIAVQKRHVTAVEFGWVHRHHFGALQLDFTLSERCGSSWFGGQSDAQKPGSDYPTFQYTLQTADASLTVPLHTSGLRLNYSTTLRAQTSRSPLYVSEQFSIGGRYTVRGFDGELTLAAERGFYWRNELDLPLAASPNSLYLALDGGKVFGASASYLVGTKLAGAALGLRGLYPHFSYDAFISWPLYKPEQFTTANRYAGLSLTFQY